MNKINFEELAEEARIYGQLAGQQLVELSGWGRFWLNLTAFLMVHAVIVGIINLIGFFL